MSISWFKLNFYVKNRKNHFLVHFIWQRMYFSDAVKCLRMGKIGWLYGVVETDRECTAGNWKITGKLKKSLQSKHKIVILVVCPLDIFMVFFLSSRTWKHTNALCCFSLMGKIAWELGCLNDFLFTIFFFPISLEDPRSISSQHYTPNSPTATFSAPSTWTIFRRRKEPRTPNTQTFKGEKCGITKMWNEK